MREDTPINHPNVAAVLPQPQGTSHNETTVSSQLECAQLMTIRNIKSQDKSGFSASVRFASPVYFDCLPLLQTPSPCAENINLIVFIPSAIQNSQRRDFIRNTWANVTTINGVNIKVVFILGTAPAIDSSKDQHKLQKEMYQHKDMVQFDFHDTYKNITYKHMLGIRWVNEFCPNTQYTLKTDDDVIVNITHVINHLFFSKQKQNGFQCNVRKNSHVVREKIYTKIYIPWEEYAASTWPDFCQGFYYMVETQFLREIYDRSDAHAFLNLDDVFVTGLMANILEIPRTQWPPIEQVYLLLNTEGEIPTLKSRVFVCMQHIDDMRFWKQVWEG